MKKILLAAMVLMSFNAVASEGEVWVFGSSNSNGGVGQPKVIDKLYNYFNENFSEEYGFRVRYHQAKDEIKRALKSGPDHILGADLVQIKDAIDLGQAKAQDFFEPVSSDVLKNNIPTHLRAQDGTWYAMSKKARVIYHHVSVDPTELTTYASLADPKWSGELCLRQSDKSYNRVLVSFFMETLGLAKTTQLIQSWVANNPFITNTDMRSRDEQFRGTIQAIHEGRCKVGVANNYYLGFYQAMYPGEDLPIRIAIPENANVNVASYGILKSSENKENAQRLLEWLSSKEAQEFDAKNSHNYPTNPEAKLSGFLKKIGRVDGKESKAFNLERASALQEQALELSLQAGWSNEPTSISN